MPKTKTRRKGTDKSRNGRTSLVPTAQSTEAPPREMAGTRRLARNRTQTSSMSVVMSVMVALGCWGLAMSFIFFSTDPNRYLFGGMAALMALMWSFSCGLRVRKIVQQR